MLCNVICNQNPNHHTKKDLKSKSKSCFKIVLEIKIQSQTISQIQNPKPFILLSQDSKKPFTFNINSISNILSVSLFLRGVSINPAELDRRSTGAEEDSVGSAGSAIRT